MVIVVDVDSLHKAMHDCIHKLFPTDSLKGFCQDLDHNTIEIMAELNLDLLAKDILEQFKT